MNLYWQHGKIISLNKKQSKGLSMPIPMPNAHGGGIDHDPVQRAKSL